MPELPDLELYLERLTPLVLERRLIRARVASPFVVRTVDPALRVAEGRKVVGLRRLGKRIVIGLEQQLFLVLHLMIAGRLRWREPGAKLPGRIGLAAFDFDGGSLILTEAGSKKRASIHVVLGAEALGALDRGGLEVLEADFGAFAGALTRENRTLKRALTDPRLFSGIGNAYSDEILHAARLSPGQRARNLDPDETRRLFEATQETLRLWIRRLAEQTEGFPEKVTAFREGMAVHGRYRLPCPVCRSPIQRIRYAGNESNYCARCQTGGRLLADRAMSRLLHADRPRRIEELE